MDILLKPLLMLVRVSWLLPVGDKRNVLLKMRKEEQPGKRSVALLYQRIVCTFYLLIQIHDSLISLPCSHVT